MVCQVFSLELGPPTHKKHHYVNTSDICKIAKNPFGKYGHYKYCTLFHFSSLNLNLSYSKGKVVPVLYLNTTP
jgi:hypothetical protein